MVKEFAFVCHPVNDMARARKFYEEVFGFKVLTEFGGESDEGQWVEYEVGESAFALGRHKDWKPSREGVCAALEVEDFDGVLSKLKEKGAEFKVEKQEFPGCFMAVVYDTEGNALTIHKRKSL